MAYQTLPLVEIKELIKPAGEASRSEFLTFLITGGTGNGKTFSITTIPAGDKGLLLDFDGKSRVVSELAPAKIDIINLKFDLNEYKTQLAITEGLYELEEVRHLSSIYQWCFVDGLTNFYALGCQASHDTVSGTGRFKLNYDKMDYVDDWVNKKLQRWASYFKYFVMFCHEDYRESQGGEIRVLPLSRKRLSQNLPGNFQEIYHASTLGTLDEVHYGWITKPEELYGNTSSVLSVPSVVPNNFDLLLSTDWRKVTVDTAVNEYEKRTEIKVTGWKKRPSNKLDKRAMVLNQRRKKRCPQKELLGKILH